MSTQQTMPCEAGKTAELADGSCGRAPKTKPSNGVARLVQDGPRGMLFANMDLREMGRRLHR